MTEKIWRGVLEWLGGRKEFNAGDVAEEFDLSYAGASQLLERLRKWGYLRVLGYDPAVHTNPKRKSQGGRRRKVYEVTEAGKRAIEWGRKRRKE